MAYAQDVLEVKDDKSESDTEGEGASRKQKKKKSGCKSQVILAKLADGTIQLPNILDMPAPEKKDLMRVFVTHHYRRFHTKPINTTDGVSGLACGKAKATVPWGHIANHLDDYIKKDYIPTNILFREPMKMGSAQVGDVLQFWCRHQQRNPQDIFCFSKWKDNDGCLQPSCLDSDTDEEITDGPIQAEATGDHREQAITGTVF